MNMTPKSISILPVLAVCLFVGNAHAQHLERTLLSSAGTQFNAGGPAIEWSVGELVVADLGAGDFRLTQGFHQGANLVGQVIARNGWAHDISIFPNPTSRELYLLKKGTDKFQLKIFDFLGQLVSEETWSTDSKSLNVRPMNAGVYLILLTDERGAFAGYKFIKH